MGDTPAASAAQPKPSAPEGRGAVPDGLGTALHGGGSGRRPLRDPTGRFSGRSLRRSDTHGLHNVSTAHRQRLHRHRPAAARHGAARAATPTGLRPRRHEPPPRSGVGTHPTAPSPARHGGRRAGDGRRRPDGADTRAGVRPTPARERHTCWPYRGFTWGWFSSTSICCWEPSRCCTEAISCAMRRPSPSSGSSPRRQGCRPARSAPP